MTFTQLKRFMIHNNVRFKDHEEQQRFTIKMAHLTINVDVAKGYFTVYGEDFISKDFDELCEFLKDGITLNSTLAKGSLNIVQLDDYYNRQSLATRIISKGFYLGLREELQQ